MLAALLYNYIMHNTQVLYVRIPISMHAEIKDTSRAERRPINTVTIMLLEEAIAARKAAIETEETETRLHDVLRSESA